jgi:sugar phosphate isomerase/epimerase
MLFAITNEERVTLPARRRPVPKPTPSEFMNFDPNRRDFLKNALLLPLAAGAGLAPVSALAEVEPIKRVGGVSLKISCNAYSFTGPLPQTHEDQSAGATLPLPKAPERDSTKKKGKKSTHSGKKMTLFDLVDFCAEHAIDGCDPTGYFFPTYPTPPPEDYLNALKRHAFEQGVGISGTGVRNSFTTADKPLRDASVRKIKTWVEVAARLGAPVLRVFCDTQMRGLTWHDVAMGATREQVRDWIVADLKECAEHGARFGVIIGVQNHGDFLQTGDQVMELIQGVDSDWCGAIVDTGYFNKAPDPYAEMAKVAPYAVNWQVKQSPFGEDSDVPMDLVRLLRIVRASGYRGYLPIETLESDPTVAVPEMVKKLRDAIAATA